MMIEAIPPGIFYRCVPIWQFPWCTTSITTVVCPDGLTVETATQKALLTWNREPLFHISSPINGWNGKSDVRKHHDYIDIKDFPRNWLSLDLTVEVEAKAKELAVLKLIKNLHKI